MVFFIADSFRHLMELLLIDQNKGLICKKMYPHMITYSQVVHRDCNGLVGSTAAQSSCTHYHIHA